MAKNFLKLFFLSLVSVFLYSCTQINTSVSAKNGVIDLGNSSFGDHDLYLLKGEWEFYWKKVYFPDDFAAGKNLPGKTLGEVPSSWLELPNTTHEGYATYRLKILLPKDVRYPTIWYRQFTSAANIYVNGKLIDSVGKFSTQAKTARQDVHPDSFEFPYPQDGVVDLVIHISNYQQYWTGGIIESIYISNRKAMDTRIMQLNSSEMFFTGAFVIIAFYYFILFFYRRTDYSTLIFSLLSLDVAMRIFTTGEKMITKIFPVIPADVYVRIEYISWYFVAPLFLHFLSFNFKLLRYKKYVKINYAIAIVFSLISLLTPTFTFTSTVHLFQLVFILQLFLLLFLIWEAYKAEKYGAKLLFFSAIFISLAALHDIAKANGTLYQQEIYFAPFALVLFLYLQMSTFAYRFYYSFNRSSTLNEGLQDKNMQLILSNFWKDKSLFNIAFQLKILLNFILHQINSTLKGEEITSNSFIREQQNVKTIKLLSTQLSNQISNVLNLSKFTPEDLDTVLTPIKLNRIILTCLSTWKSTIKEKELFIRNLVGEQHFVYADERYLDQILHNIMRVACDYTIKKEIEIRATPQGDFLGVSIFSTFSPESIDIFEKSMEEDIQTDIEHFCFQLVLSKKLIELQGGELHLLENKKRTTVEFYFTLPLSYEEEIEDVMEYVADSPTELVRGFEENVRFQEEVSTNSWFSQMHDSQLNALIISSDKANGSLMENSLHSLRISSILADTGTQGLKALELDSSFDVLIIDSVLADMSGYELSKKIRVVYTASTFPILMITSNGRMQEVFAVFENGANDYIAKPFDKNEFLVRINLLVSFKSAMSEREKIKSMEKELGMAKKIQDSLLPKEIPQIDSIQFATLYLPMSMVGGDYYDIKQISDSSFSVLVADVSGHGVPASLIASMLKISFQQNEKLWAFPAQLFRSINRNLSGNLDNNFLTAIYAYFDLDKKTVTIARAGHPPVLIKSQDVDEVKEVKPPGPIVGFSEDSVYKEETVELTAGDRFVFYSDGITELNPAGSEGLDEREEYGDQKFSEFIQLSAPVEANAFISLLVENIFDYSGLDTFDDDLTMVVVDYRP